MNKIKIIFITFFLFLFLNSCGYTPQYAKNNNINFSIDLKTISGDRDFNNSLKSKLNRYSKNNDNSNRNFEISAISKYDKSITLRDNAGLAKEYELEIVVEFFIQNNGNEKKLTLKEKFNMKKMSDSFEESSYEKTIKNNFANIIKEKLISYLFKL